MTAPPAIYNPTLQIVSHYISHEDLSIYTEESLLINMRSKNYYLKTFSWACASGFEIDSLHELTNQIDFEQASLPDYFYKNKNILETSFTKELLKYKHYLTITDEEATSVFNSTASQLSELPFEKATVEITPSNSLKFTLLFADNKLLLVSKPFDALEDLNENEIVFSFFINRELIISNATSTSAFVEGFKEFLSM